MYLLDLFLWYPHLRYKLGIHIITRIARLPFLINFLILLNLNFLNFISLLTFIAFLSESESLTCKWLFLFDDSLSIVCNNVRLSRLIVIINIQLIKSGAWPRILTTTFLWHQSVVYDVIPGVQNIRVFFWALIFKSFSKGVSICQFLAHEHHDVSSFHFSFRIDSHILRGYQNIIFIVWICV